MKGAQESQQGRRQLQKKKKKKKKKIANTCIFFQHCKVLFQHLQINTKLFTFQMYSINQNLHL